MKIQSILLSALLALPAFNQTFTSTSLANPSEVGSLQANWSVAPDGSAVFSWIEPSSGGSFALRYAVRQVMLSTGHAFGYTAMALDEDGGAIVLWLEQSPAGARVLVRRISAAGVAGPIVEVAKGRKMALGYPKLFHNGGDTFIAWGDPKHVRTASLAKKD